MRVKGNGFAGRAKGTGPVGCVRQGLSKNGNNQIHIVASMVRYDGTKRNSRKSKYKSQQLAGRWRKSPA